MKKFKNILYYLAIILLLIRCVEPYDAGTQNFEDSLVVQATVTDEFKHQKILLGRTLRLEDSLPRYEINATVKIVDNLQNVYDFKEQDSGLYVSVNKFKIEDDREYSLKIKTSLGRNYASEPTRISEKSSQVSVIAKKGINKDGVEGLIIYANSFDASSKSKRYRFEYEETYKIIAPYWSPLDAYGSTLPVNDPPDPFYHEVFTRPRLKEERVCYNTLYSNAILLTKTTQLTEDRVSDYEVLFLPKNDFKITHRYSILVRQMVQSPEVFSYYNTLKELSGETSLFSQNQPGFIKGNLYSEDDSDENVIGYFDVASATSQRIFFNFEDFFPVEPKPPYIVGCYVITPELDEGGPSSETGKFSPLLTQINYYGLKFVDFTDSPNSNNPIYIVRKECSDCTALGSNMKPDFWIN